MGSSTQFLNDSGSYFSVANERAIGGASTNDELATKEKRTLSQKMDPHAQKAQYVGHPCIGAMSGVENVDAQNSSVEMEESSMGLSNVISASVAGLFFLKYLERNRNIPALRDSLFTLGEEYEVIVQELEAATEPSAVDLLRLRKNRLSNQLATLEKSLREEVVSKEKFFSGFFSKLGQSGLATTRKTALIMQLTRPGTHAAANSQHAAEFAIGIGSLLVLVLSSRELMKNYRVAQKFSKEIEAIQALFNESESEIVRQALRLRLLNLQKQVEENYIKTTRDLLMLTSGAFGTAASGELISSSVGVGAGVTFGAALTASGIGAIATAALAILGGSGYCVYKHRETIRFYSKDMRLACVQKVREKYLDLLYYQRRKIQDEIRLIEQVISEYNKDDEYREKIDEVWEEIEKLKSAFSEESEEILSLKRKHQELIMERMSKYVGGRVDVRKSDDWTLSAAFNSHDIKVRWAISDLDQIMGRRDALKESYRHRKYLPRFSTPSDGQSVTMEHLQAFEDEISTCNPEDLRLLFHAQIDRVSTVVDLTAFAPDCDRRRMTDETMRGITARVV